MFLDYRRHGGSAGQLIARGRCLAIGECPSQSNYRRFNRKLAAVRREVEPGAVGSAWRPALDKVWGFVRSQPRLQTDGHNIFLYHHPDATGRADTVRLRCRGDAQHLKLRATSTRPKRWGARLPSPPTRIRPTLKGQSCTS